MNKVVLGLNIPKSFFDILLENEVLEREQKERLNKEKDTKNLKKNRIKEIKK